MYRCCSHVCLVKCIVVRRGCRHAGKCMEQDAFCSATGIGDRVYGRLATISEYRRKVPRWRSPFVGIFQLVIEYARLFPSLFLPFIYIVCLPLTLLFLSTEKSKHHALPLSNTPIHPGHQPPPKRRCRFTPSLATRVSTDICRRGRLPPSSLPSDSTVARFLVL